MQLLSEPYLHIDLFAGCGGISVGLHKAGWKGLFAIEKSNMAFETLKFNLIDNNNHFDWPDWLPFCEHDIVEVLRDYRHNLEQLRGKVDLVAGGPPCQGFSFAGKRDQNDARNKLVQSYVKFVSIVKPTMLLFENVKGFNSDFRDGKNYAKLVRDGLTNLGYVVRDKIIDFSEFGVPQKRRRFILVGMLNGCPDRFFSRLYQAKKGFLERKGLPECVTLSQAISDLERIHGESNSAESPLFNEGIYGQANSSYQKYVRSFWPEKKPTSHRFARHRKATVERFKFILENCPRNEVLSKEYKDLFKLKKRSIVPLDSESVCPSLTTLPDDYIHYSEPRILTVREYARIQSFDDSYRFMNKYTTGGLRRKIQVPRYTQLGNAFPPLFAELIGTVLTEQIPKQTSVSFTHL